MFLFKGLIIGTCSYSKVERGLGGEGLGVGGRWLSVGCWEYRLGVGGVVDKGVVDRGVVDMGLGDGVMG
jgi:hypothetical protein